MMMMREKKPQRNDHYFVSFARDILATVQFIKNLTLLWKHVMESKTFRNFKKMFPFKFS